jgi:hypothetical protein
MLSIWKIVPVVVALSLLAGWLSYRSFGRLRISQAQRLRYALIAGLAALPLAYFSLISGYNSVAAKYPDREFNPQYWLAQKGQRYEMTRSLLRSNRLIGLSPEQVAQLLGPPDQQSASVWNYEVSSRAASSTSSLSLLQVEFEKGQVVRCFVHRT